MWKFIMFRAGSKLPGADVWGESILLENFSQIEGRIFSLAWDEKVFLLEDIWSGRSKRETKKTLSKAT